MTQTTPLAACPFCGGEAQRHTIGEDEPSNAGGDVICCTRCQASSHVEFGRKENLVSAWNQRTHPTAQHGDLVERLRRYTPDVIHPTLAGLMAEAATALTASDGLLPDRPNEALVEILGRPNFMCIKAARVLKASGWDIPPKSEVEQACVILFTLKHWLADPENWEANADAELQTLARRALAGEGGGS